MRRFVILTVLLSIMPTVRVCRCEGAEQVQPPPSPGKLGITSPEVHADRRVTFRFFAPEASRVIVGGRNNEKGWISAGRVNFIMDNLLAEDKAVPMLIVMPHCYGKGGLGGSIREENIRQFASHFLSEVVPFVEEIYRVSKKEARRAVAGFSVGAAQARTIGLNNLDLFSYIGLFSGGNGSTTTGNERVNVSWPTWKASGPDCVCFG